MGLTGNSYLDNLRVMKLKIKVSLKPTKPKIPFVKKPLTGYERLKRYRAKRKAEGWKNFQLFCPPELHTYLKGWAVYWASKNKVA